MNDENGRYVIGVDAGGTLTRVILVDESGEELARREGPPFNYRQADPDVLCDFLTEAIPALVEEAGVPGGPAAIAAGVAGAGTQMERHELTNHVRSCFPDSNILIHHDAFTAWYGAFAGYPGVIVIAGTGSIAYGRNGEGEEARAGGWGWMLGDEGSGWWIGRAAVRAALRAWQGSGEPTELSDLLKERFDLGQVYDIVPKLYSGDIPRRRISELVPDIANIARTGDEVARQLFFNAGVDLVEMALDAARLLEIPGSELKYSLLGGVARGAEDLLEQGIYHAAMAHSPDTGDSPQPVLPAPPKMDAVRGAAQWALDTTAGDTPKG